MSIADEIRKLKELLDAGVLSQDEFQQAKKNLIFPLTTGSSSPNSDTRRQWLSAFKQRFAAEACESESKYYENRIGAVLDEAEDTLIKVCGRERCDSFRQAANEIVLANARVQDARKNGDSDERRFWQEQMKQMQESLRLRVVGIEISE